MRSFNIIDLFKDAFVIRTPEPAALKRASHRMKGLVDLGPDEIAGLPDRSTFTPFATDKAYIIRPEELLNQGTSYLDLHQGYSSYLLLDGCTQVEEITPRDGKEFHLEQLYEVTGSPVDVVSDLPGLPNHIMIINDEGWLYNEPQHNMMASLIASRPIAGTVIVCPDSMFN